MAVQDGEREFDFSPDWTTMRTHLDAVGRVQSGGRHLADLPGVVTDLARYATGLAFAADSRNFATVGYWANKQAPSTLHALRREARVDAWAGAWAGSGPDPMAVLRDYAVVVALDEAVNHRGDPRRDVHVLLQRALQNTLGPRGIARAAAVLASHRARPLTLAEWIAGPSDRALAAARQNLEVLATGAFRRGSSQRRTISSLATRAREGVRVALSEQQSVTSGEGPAVAGRGSARTTFDSGRTAAPAGDRTKTAGRSARR